MTTVTKRKYRHKLRFSQPYRFRIYATIEYNLCNYDLSATLLFL